VVTKAVVRSSDGYVVNVSVVDEDATWEAPAGYVLIDAEYPAQPGAIWNGSSFSYSVPAPSRIEVLMQQGPATQLYDEETEAMVDRPAEDIAADKAELLGLLQSKLAASEDLTWEQMNKMLKLEHES
jgi:hypothetical protein